MNFKKNSYHDFFQVLPCMCVFVLMYKSFFSFLTLKEFGMYNEKKPRLSYNQSSDRNNFTCLFF